VKRNCKCKDCYGLAEYMRDLTGKDYGLKRAEGHKGKEPALPGRIPCDGSMTCGCKRCSEQKQLLVTTHKPRVKQPWEV